MAFDKKARERFDNLKKLANDAAALSFALNEAVELIESNEEDLTVLTQFDGAHDWQKPIFTSSNGVEIYDQCFTVNLKCGNIRRHQFSEFGNDTRKVLNKTVTVVKDQRERALLKKKRANSKMFKLGSLVKVDESLVNDPMLKHRAAADNRMHVRLEPKLTTSYAKRNKDYRPSESYQRYGGGYNHHDRWIWPKHLPEFKILDVERGKFQALSKVWYEPRGFNSQKKDWDRLDAGKLATVVDTTTSKTYVKVIAEGTEFWIRKSVLVVVQN